ncbi:hypothetical protein GIB67_031510 [Kingdonia uniflora]|uniref:Uncharacterized protein n=1 Tax=Kingdonia uniflora TaxID=39325 RepID=A0A7J7MN66_9MAGN|nr:hypothetical protein GIB67_031510 [Kingdonia uniflora]
MLEDFGLSTNKWLSDLFKICHKWALVYRCDNFCVDMTTTYCKAGKGNRASSARGSESDTNKLATVTSNDGDEALLVVATDGSRHDRGWVFDSAATTFALNGSTHEELYLLAMELLGNGLKEFDIIAKKIEEASKDVSKSKNVPPHN